MEIVCDNCKTEYDFDESRISEDGIAVKCSTCGNVFKVRRRTLLTTEPLKPTGGKRRDWMIRKEDGRVLAFRELTTLQRWIAESKVTRHDEISRTGDRWKQLGEIPELAAFFSMADSRLDQADQTVPSAAPLVAKSERTVELSMSDVDQLDGETVPYAQALEPVLGVGAGSASGGPRDHVRSPMAQTVQGMPQHRGTSEPSVPEPQPGPRSMPNPSAAVVAAATGNHAAASRAGAGEGEGTPADSTPPAAEPVSAPGPSVGPSEGGVGSASEHGSEPAFGDFAEVPSGEMQAEPSFEMGPGGQELDETGPSLGGGEQARERYTARYRSDEPSQDVSLEMGLVRSRSGAKIAGVLVVAIVLALMVGVGIYLFQAKPAWFSDLVGGLGGLVDSDKAAEYDKLVTRGWALVDLDTEEDYEAALEKFEEAGGDDEKEGYPAALAAAAETHAIWAGYLLDDAALLRKVAREAAAAVAPEPEPEPPPEPGKKSKKGKKGKTAAPATAAPVVEPPPPPIDPKLADPIEEAGRAKMKEAHALARSALKRDPDAIQALRTLAHVHRLLGELDEMKNVADEVLERSKDDVETLVILGASYVGDPDAAEKGIELLTRALKGEPKHLRAHYWLARIYYDQGKTEAAIAELDAVLKVNPSHLRAARLKKVLEGDFMAIKGAAGDEVAVGGGDGGGDGDGSGDGGGDGSGDGEPVAATAAPVTAAPGTAATSAIAATAGSSGDGDDAATGPASVERGLKLLEAGKADAAVKVLKAVLESSPDDVPAMIGLGYGYLDTAKAGAAVAIFNRALAVDPRNGDAIMGHARALKNAGRNAEAADEYRHYLELYPTGPAARGAKFQLEKLGATVPDAPKPTTAAPSTAAPAEPDPPDGPKDEPKPKSPPESTPAG